MTDFSNSQKQFLKQLVADLKADFDKQAQEIKEEVKQQIGDLKRDIQVSLKNYEEKISILEKKNKILENKVIELDRKTRKNNIIIFGLNKVEANLQTAVLKLFNESLKLNILESDINDSYYLGPKDKTETPILIEFHSYQKKLLLLKNWSKLREYGIFVAHDQNKEDRAIKKILLKHRWEARNKGIQAFIKGNKLQIGDELYTVEELEKDKPNSAPSTPNPHSRQKRLLDEFGADKGDIQQDNKKSRSEAKTLTPRTLRSKSNYKPVES